MDTVLVLARTHSTGWQTGCWVDDVVHVRYTDTDILILDVCNKASDKKGL
jgi:hypothetical protein